MTIIKTTRHFEERTKERGPSENGLDWYIDCFKLALDSVKRGRVYPRAGGSKNTYILKYSNYKMVYAKENGEYKLITFGILK